MEYVEEGIVHKISVGKELIQDSIMGYTVGYDYKKNSLKVIRIQEVFEDGLYWVKVYVTKNSDDDNLVYLWMKIGDNIKIQYDVELV